MREGSLSQNFESRDRQGNWREFLNYPDHLKPKSKELLDQIVSLIPFPDSTDKYVVMSQLVDGAAEKGLITRQERLSLREDIAQNL